MLKYKERIDPLIWIIVFEVIGFLLGMLTQANLVWYEKLNKSALTPPGSVFSIVWSILYALIAIVGWALWRNRNNDKIRQLGYLYFIQLIMNWAWTPFFFQLHWTGFSFLWITLMTGLNGVIIIAIKNEKKRDSSGINSVLSLVDICSLSKWSDLGSQLVNWGTITYKYINERK